MSILAIEDCFVYELEFSKLTKANSVVIDNRIVYIVKKDYRGSASPFFTAYDYTTKVQILFNKDKKKLIEILKTKNLGVFDE